MLLRLHSPLVADILGAAAAAAAAAGEALLGSLDARDPLAVGAARLIRWRKLLNCACALVQDTSAAAAGGDRRFVEGDMIEVVNGPFKGMRGAVCALETADELTAMLAVMGVDTPVTLQKSHCAALSMEEEEAEEA